MALLTSEIERIRVELGYNALTVGAEPYVSYVAVFDQIIAEYLQGGASTTSSTAVTAVTPPTSSAQVTLTLALITGFHAGDRVAVDVDARYESATVQSVSGSTITLLLAGTHSGTYPVTVEGGEMIVREALRDIAACKAERREARGMAGLKRLDEVEWHATAKGGSSALAEYRRELMELRDELAAALGVTNLWRMGRGGYSSSPVLY